MDTYEETFVREAKSQIQTLNDGLMAAETGEDAPVDELFRVAHSLKGSCRVQGLTAAGDLAHALEDVLSALRDGDVEPTSTLIDETLAAVDLLETTIQAATTDSDPDHDIDAIQRSLRATLEEHRTQTPADDRSDATPEHPESDADWTPSEAELNADVVAALEETTEFDDLDALVDEQAANATDDELGSWGLLDEGDAPHDDEPQPSESSTSETPDNPATVFEETKEQLDDEPELESLQEEIDAVEFGEFDDDDNYSIGELVELDPDQTPPAADTPSDETPGDGNEGEPEPPTLADQAAAGTEAHEPSSDHPSDEATDADSADSVVATERADPPGADATPPAQSADHPSQGGHTPTDEATTTDADEPETSVNATTAAQTEQPEHTDGEQTANTFVFDQEPAESPSQPGGSDTETSERGQVDAVSDPDAAAVASASETPSQTTDPAPGVSDAGEDPALPAADADESELATAPDVELPENLGAAVLDDDEDESEMDIAVDDGIAEFESQFNDLLGDESTQDPEQTDGPTFQSAVATIEESTLDVDAFPTTAGSTAFDAVNGVEQVQTMTVDVDTADQLLNVAEELSLTHLRLDEAVGPDTDDTIREEVATLRQLVTEYRQTVMGVRLMPLRTAVETIPRTVRDIARSQDKDVELVINDVDVELDRGIIDQLKDPLVHIARNAVDHGIEPPDDRVAAGKPPEGTIEIRAEQDGDEISIEIADDGRGIEPEAIRQRAVDKDVLTQAEARQLADEETYELLFEPGFTTREEVTEISGRGVGMDVVGQTIADLNGTVTVDSDPGEGTTVRLTVPVSIVFTEVLFVEAGGQTFGIPRSAIEQITAVPQVQTVDGCDVVQRSELDFAGGLPDDVDAADSYPLIRLDAALDLPDLATAGADADGQIVWVRAETERLALHCDRVITSREVVVRPYGDVLRDVAGLSGATTLGDGEAVNVLDVGALSGDP